MGDIRHWVLKINPTTVLAVTIASVFFYLSAGRIADAIKEWRSEVNLTINNEGDAKAFKYVDGKFIQVPMEKKK